MYTKPSPHKAQFFSFQGFFIFLLTIYSTLSFNIAESQGSHKSGSGSDFGNDCKIILDDGISYYTIPFRFSGKDWLYTLAGAGAIGGIMTIDDDVKTAVVGDNSNVTSGAWSVGKDYGNILYAGTGSVLLYTAGLLTHDKGIRVTGRMLIQSLLYSGIAATGMKYITGRTRPYLTNNQYDFNWFKSGNDYFAFPSGHTTVAFAMSSVFAESIDKWWARVIFYSLAAATGYSRIHDNQHWLSDVVLGGVIGFSSGYFTVHKEMDRNKKKSDITDKINFSLSVRGMDFVYKF